MRSFFSPIFEGLGETAFEQLGNLELELDSRLKSFLGKLGGHVNGSASKKSRSKSL